MSSYGEAVYFGVATLFGPYRQMVMSAIKLKCLNASATSNTRLRPAITPKVEPEGGNTCIPNPPKHTTATMCKSGYFLILREPKANLFSLRISIRRRLRWRRLHGRLAARQPRRRRRRRRFKGNNHHPLLPSPLSPAPLTRIFPFLLQSYGDESLRPVTIKQVAEYTEPFPNADVTIDGAPLTQLTLVGQIRKINPQATNITYTLDDGTATIEVKKWVDAERDGDDDGSRFAEDQYVRVWGRLKRFNNKNHVGAHFIRAVEDYNEVNYHLVEAAYVHLYITKGPPVPGGGGDAAQQQRQQAGAGGDSMFVDDGYGTGGGGGGDDTSQQKLARTSAAAKKVFNYLEHSPGGNEGVNVHVIAQGTHMSAREVFAAMEELSQGGLVYTTIDDSTFAILEY